MRDDNPGIREYSGRGFRLQTTAGGRHRHRHLHPGRCGDIAGRHAGRDLPLALASLYAGIVLGDLGLYGLGFLSASHPWARRLVPKRRRDIGQDWVSSRIVPLVLVSRFVPGLRLPTYTTLGFLHAPLRQFAAAVVVATLIWTSGLFYISLKLGVLMMRYLGVWRWAGLTIFLIVLVIVGRFATRLYNKRTSA